MHVQVSDGEFARDSGDCAGVGRGEKAKDLESERSADLSVLGAMFAWPAACEAQPGIMQTHTDMAGMDSREKS
jgi:hypothetical protein